MQRRSGSEGRTVIVHSLAHARAALEAAAEAGQPVTVLSARGAAAYAGAGWFRHLARRAAAEVPAARVLFVLDCGRFPGLVLGALRAGCPAVRFTGPAATAKRLAMAAEARGAVLHTGPAPHALDLAGEPDPLAACRRWLARPRPRR